MRVESHRADDRWDDGNASGSNNLLGQSPRKPEKQSGSGYIVLADYKDGALRQGLKNNLKLSVSPKTLKEKEPQDCWVMFQDTVS